MLENVRFNRLNFLMALVFLSVTAHFYGVYNWYTPIPFWDSWTSYLYFDNSNSGNYFNYFFGNHNGHTITTHRVIEILDWEIFSGKQYLTTIALAIFPIIVGMFLAGQSDSKYGVVSIIGMLSWSQKENFTWAFQGQMYLVIIFSLLAFKYVCNFSRTNSKKDGVLYFIFAALSIISMGNGVVVPVLGLMLFYFSNKRIFKNKTFYLVNILLIVLGLLLRSRGGSNLPVASIYEAIFSGFALSGSPIYYLLGLGKGSALIVGLGIFAVSCCIIINSSNKIISTYIVFCWITIFGISYSRAATEPFTIWYTSRYQGVIISLWISVIIQFSFLVNNKMKLIINAVVIFLLLGSTKLSLATQFENTSWYHFERSLAVIALINGIDEKQVAQIYPDLMIVRTLTDRARKNCNGVFSSERFIDICIDKNSNEESQNQHKNNLNAIMIKENVKINEIIYKIEEVDGWFKYFIITDCNWQMRGHIDAVKIKTENKEILGIIGKDIKNFGNKCRIGFYAKSKINQLKNFDIIGVQ